MRKRITFPIGITMYDAKYKRMICVDAGEYLMEEITNPLGQKASEDNWLVITGTMIGLSLKDFELSREYIRVTNLSIRVRVVDERPA